MLAKVEFHLLVWDLGREQLVVVPLEHSDGQGADDDVGHNLAVLAVRVLEGHGHLAVLHVAAGPVDARDHVPEPDHARGELLGQAVDQGLDAARHDDVTAGELHRRTRELQAALLYLNYQ